MLENESELTKEEENELREFGVQCFEEYWTSINDEKQSFSVLFKIASASGYLVALQELGYISADETKSLIRSLKMRI
jgi:hypothetical protein